MLDLVKLSDGTRLVKCRNPWGIDLFHGKWSDQSELWTDELAKEVGFVKNKNDGIFFMSIEDYVSEFDMTEVNFNKDDMHMDFFLMLDDQTKNQPGIMPNCGKDCIHHKLRVVSDVDQEVWITAHTWSDHALPEQCKQEMKK